MDHMRFETPDLVQADIEKIDAVFPSFVAEVQGRSEDPKKEQETL